MPSSRQRPTMQQIEEEQRKIGEARRKWVLTDAVKADHQLQRNREERLKIEGPPVLSNSYGW